MRACVRACQKKRGGGLIARYGDENTHVLDHRVRVGVRVSGSVGFLPFPLFFF